MFKQNKYIQVYEHESLFNRPNDSGNYLTKEQFDKLCQYNDAHGNKYFTTRRNGVRFHQFVGVIQVGGITLEILPKTDNDLHTNWHHILLDMLTECKKIKREFASSAKLRHRRNSLLDIYIQMFLQEVKGVLRKGLTKRYERKRNQQKALRGKLLVSDHLIKNFIHKERFYTESTYYLSDNIYNQILKRCLGVITKLDCYNSYREDANKLMTYFYQVSDLSRVHSQVFQRLSFDRNNQYYEEGISIARLILLNYSPDIRSGTTDLMALLFDMNKLWEEYIYRQLLKSRSGSYQVLPQLNDVFWQSNNYKRRIKPDIVIKDLDETIVIDTKWKIIDQAKPSDADLKQIFAYNIYWNCAKSILIYPRTRNSPDDSLGKYLKGMQTGHGCKVCFVNLIADNRLNEKIGLTIWELITE
ncbi:MAG: hypothetical protein WBA74_08215 [Cyclobacteriaceae bacterium]